jgi:hypothetical protein
MIFYALISFFGCVFGYIIANFCKDELKFGKLYFKILELIILFSLTLYLFSFDLLFFIIGFLIAIIIRFEYFYFGIGFISSGNFLYSSLIFVYGLPFGSLIFMSSNWKKLLINLILFLAGLSSYFIYYSLDSFAAGGLFFIFVHKFYKLF